MLLKLVSLMGLVVFVGLAWLCSSDRKKFPWRTAWAGLALQFFFALVILKTDVGKQVFLFAQLAVQKLNQVANEGAKMVFGPLANEAFLTEKWGPDNAVIFAILVTATIIVVAALQGAERG